MLSFIGKRLAVMVLTMVAVSVLVFVLLEIDPDRVATGVLGPYSSDEQRAIWLTENGYDAALLSRYLTWLGRFFTGELGQSIRFNAPVADVLWPRLWNTIVLGFWVMAVVVPLSLALGVLSGMRVGSPLDRGVSVFCIITTSIPEFATATFFTSIFVFGLDLLPGTSGMIGGFDWRQLVLPVLVLATYDVGYVARITRASMADVMTAPYIRTAVLKGLPFRTVVLKHALRNALIAPFTVLLLQINWLLNGVIVVEFAFGYKGFGALLLEASLNGDVFLIEACAMVAVFVAVTTQMLADVGYRVLNPRLRAPSGTTAGDAKTNAAESAA